MNNVFLHLHPVRVRQHAVKFAYTFCLGGLSFFFFLVLTVTGVYLMFFYVPSATQAYSDILRIQSEVPFGLLARNIHRWAAHLMVFFVFLHMMRVFYHGAYKPPREFNWVVGVVLLFLTVFLSFTGYLLPWDQIAYWAITIGGNMAKFDKTFPTLDCSACILTPKMVSLSHRRNIKLMTYHEVVGISGYIGNYKVRIKRKARYVDPEKCTACGDCEKVCDLEIDDDFNYGLAKRKAIALLLALPHGVMRMSADIEGLVETSNNLATVKVEDGELTIISNQRSSNMDSLALICDRVLAVAQLAGAEGNTSGGYPAWQPNMQSELLARCLDVYEKRFGKKPVVEAIHAGLECGIIGANSFRQPNVT